MLGFCDSFSFLNLTNRIEKFEKNNIYMFQTTYIYATVVCRKKLIYMSKEEQILKLIEDNNGVITTKKNAQNDINRVFLTRFINKGQLERAKKRFICTNLYLG